MFLSEVKLRSVCFMRRKLGFCECDVSEGGLSLVLYVSLNWRSCLYICLLNEEILICGFVFK
jgi:hypothetical protein